MANSDVFISTSIPYVNGPPHVGFAWELVLADGLARYHRARDRRVLFLTGTDDNSLKNVRAAEAEGRDTAEFVRERGERFADLGRALGLSNDDFLRTAFDVRHAPAVAKLWRACQVRGDVYPSRYRGTYCVGCEQFLAPHELTGGRCPDHAAPLEAVDEVNHFFRLSQHQALVDGLLSSQALHIWPEVYRTEVYGWVRAGLADFSISRSSERARGWGVPVPGDPEQVVYVWFDALTNYISALGYAQNGPLFQELWQGSGRRIHVIGKNVTRFHCIYWPAILHAAGLAAPTDVVVHGFLTVEGRKIGKSLGNGVDPFALIERFGAERVRHYLLRHFPLGRDGDFSSALLIQASNDELTGQLGNLLERLLALLEQNTAGQVPSVASDATELSHEARRATRSASEAFERCDPPLALASAFGLVRACNLELARTEPWRLARRARATTDPVEREALDARWRNALGDVARGLLWAAALLEPCLPQTAARVAHAFGVALPSVYAGGSLAWPAVSDGARAVRGPLLFERLERQV